MINNVVLVGRLTKDPELRMTQSGASVANLTLAVNRKIQAQGQPDADFINCIAWNKTAELLNTYTHKGSLIGVEGRIQTRSYENNQGTRIYVTEVVIESLTFLEPKSNAQAQNTQGNVNVPQSQNNAQNAQKNGFQYAGSLTAQAEADTLVLDSDDLPF